MSQAFTKAMARNVFYGGSVSFFLLFFALTFDTHTEWPNRDNHENITGTVAEGKRLWEENNNCACRAGCARRRGRSLASASTPIFN